MREIRQEPILTETYGAAADFTPVPKSVYFYGQSSEARSGHISTWQSRAHDISVQEIREQQAGSFKIAGRDDLYSLRSSAALSSLFSHLPKHSPVYIDITGLSHSVWAALLKAALQADADVRAVYVEPSAYGRSAAPVDGQIYDLSLRVTGIAPLPSFAVLSPSSSSDFIFVPLLGFEGPRFRHLIEQVQPAADKVIPVIGAPGFKPWYVFETYAGNRAALIEKSAWQSVRYAPANCPFSCFYLLSEIARAAPRSIIKIAPIGTKPHALGAVLFALSSDRTELVYDHPIPKSGRTDGADRLLVFHVSGLVVPYLQAIATARTIRRGGLRT